MIQRYLKGESDAVSREMILQSDSLKQELINGNLIFVGEGLTFTVTIPQFIAPAAEM